MDAYCIFWARTALSYMPVFPAAEMRRVRAEKGGRDVRRREGAAASKLGAVCALKCRGICAYWKMTRAGREHAWEARLWDPAASRRG